MRFAKMKRKEIRGILHGSILGKEVRLGIRQIEWIKDGRN